MAKEKPEVHDLSHVGVIHNSEIHSLSCPSIPDEMRERAIEVLTNNSQKSERRNGPAMVNSDAYRDNHDRIFSKKDNRVKN